MEYRPSEEDILTFFDGFSKNCYLVYGATHGGFGMSAEAARLKWEKKSHSFFNILSPRLQICTLEDFVELSLELSMNKAVEEMLTYFWSICGVIGKESEITSVADRVEFMRPISDTGIIAYFLGISWFFKATEERREERLIKFLLLVKERLKLQIQETTINQMWRFFYETDLMEELRLTAIDHFQVRHCITGKPLKAGDKPH